MKAIRSIHHRVVLPLLLLMFFLLLCFSIARAAASATNYYVCSGAGCGALVTHSTISAALTAASTDDSIFVAMGTYSENLTIDQDVTLHGGWSRDFAVYDATLYTTTIAGSGTGPVVQIENGASPVVRGFTIAGGHSSRGGGINIRYAGGTIQENTISNNEATRSGAGIAVTGDSTSPPVTITQNQIINNRTSNGATEAGIKGAGIYIAAVLSPISVTVQGNEIRGNIADFSPNVSGGSEGGGGLHVATSTSVSAGLSNILIDSNVIISNTGRLDYVGSGGIEMDGSGITFTNNIVARNLGGISAWGGAFTGTNRIINNTIVENTASSFSFGGHGVLLEADDKHFDFVNNIVVNNDNYGIYTAEGSGSYSIEYNDVWGNGTNYASNNMPAPDLTGINGNVSTNPLFANPGSEDWHLSACSPLIDTGTNDYAPSFDYEGDARPFNAITDIGADEYTGGSTCFKIMLPTIMNNR